MCLTLHISEGVQKPRSLSGAALAVFLGCYQVCTWPKYEKPYLKTYTGVSQYFFMLHVTVS